MRIAVALAVAAMIASSSAPPALSWSLVTKWWNSGAKEKAKVVKDEATTMFKSLGREKCWKNFLNPQPDC